MKVSAKRYKIFCKLMGEMDASYKLMRDYDSFPHKYGDDILYQVETHIIQAIGRKPGIIVTELATLLSKTPSACSQSVRKLRKKGWVEQIRNQDNNREYNLQLTEDGWKIYNEHEKFDQKCYERNCSGLEKFTDEELNTFIEIQKQINKSFQMDVDEARETFSHIEKEE